MSTASLHTCMWTTEVAWQLASGNTDHRNMEVRESLRFEIYGGSRGDQRNVFTTSLSDSFGK